MDVSMSTPAVVQPPVLVSGGNDQFGEPKILGISQVDFKVSSHESKDIFAVEITLRQKGGPARHVHFTQDEWFYIVEGQFILEVGDKRFQLKPGDSLFAPRKIPHVWASISEGTGRLLATVSPAGKLEAFFIEADKKKSLPGPDQNQWRPYDLEWVGPPLKID